MIAGFQPNNIENKTAIFQYFNISRKQDSKKTRFHVFKISFLIEPFQQIHDVAFPVDDFSRKLHVPQQSRVPVILQSPFADAKSLAYFLTRQVVFTVQYRAIVHYHVLHVFQYPVKEENSTNVVSESFVIKSIRLLFRIVPYLVEQKCFHVRSLVVNLIVNLRIRQFPRITVGLHCPG